MDLYTSRQDSLARQNHLTLESSFGTRELSFATEVVVQPAVRQRKTKYVRNRKRLSDTWFASAVLYAGDGRTVELYPMVLFEDLGELTLSEALFFACAFYSSAESRRWLLLLPRLVA